MPRHNALSQCKCCVRLSLPNHNKEIVELEKVKKRMTRLIKGTEQLLYEETNKLGLSWLERQLR